MNPGPLLEDVIGAHCVYSLHGALLYCCEKLRTDVMSRLQRLLAAQYHLKIARSQLSRTLFASISSKPSAATSQMRSVSALCGCTSAHCQDAVCRQTSTR